MATFQGVLLIQHEDDDGLLRYNQEAYVKNLTEAQSFGSVEKVKRDTSS